MNLIQPGPFTISPDALWTRSTARPVSTNEDDVSSSPTRVSLDRAKRRTGDILFTYLIHSGTALYVGYNDRRENWLWVENGSGPLLGGGAPSFSSGRQVLCSVICFICERVGFRPQWKGIAPQFRHGRLSPNQMFGDIIDPTHTSFLA
jgi:hypothetical protein